MGVIRRLRSSRLSRAVHYRLRHYCHRCGVVLWTWEVCPHHSRFMQG